MVTKQRKSSIAITGSSGLVGKNLISELAGEKSIDKIIAIDKVHPKIKSSKIKFSKIDIIDTESIEIVGKLLSDNKCKTLIHCALPNEPSKHIGRLHELQVIGSMNILLAAEAGKIRKLLLGSTTEVFGAMPSNPSYLTEKSSLRGNMHSSYLRDKIDVERQFNDFQMRHPKKIVTILRPCTILGQKLKNSKISYLLQPTVTTALGFDPLMQFVHISDVTRAFLIAVKKDYPGIFNIVGDGVLPLSRALSIENKSNLPIPDVLLQVATRVLWNLNMSHAPAGHVDFLKYQCIADGEKARRVMGFKPTYSSEDALLSLKSMKEIKKKLT
jgi:UDP-glucose 4-epimerase